MPTCEASADALWMARAEIVSRFSPCSRRQVGAVVVSDGWIISESWNRVPGKVAHLCPREQSDVLPYSPYDDPESPGYCTAVHAEVWALMWALHASLSGPLELNLYVTDEPCAGCKKFIAACEVFYGPIRVVTPKDLT